MFPGLLLSLRASGPPMNNGNGSPATPPRRHHQQRVVGRRPVGHQSLGSHTEHVTHPSRPFPHTRLLSSRNDGLSGTFIRSYFPFAFIRESLQITSLYFVGNMEQ